MSKPLKYLLFFIAGTLFGVFGTTAFNSFFSREANTPLAYLSWRVSGRPVTFDCTVRFQDGAPAEGFNIAFLSNSGWTPSECINAHGQAYVHSGETDVQAVRINDKVIMEWPGAYWTGFPSVRKGLRVDIVLKSRGDWFTSVSASK